MISASAKNGNKGASVQRNCALQGTAHKNTEISVYFKSLLLTTYYSGGARATHTTENARRWLAQYSLTHSSALLIMSWGIKGLFGASYLFV